MKHLHTNKSKMYIIATVLLAGVFFVSVGFIFLQMWERRQKYSGINNGDVSSVTYRGKEYELKQNLETFLVLGLDKFEEDTLEESYNNDRQADFLLLFIFDNQAKTCTALQINRDTICEFNVLGLNGNSIGTTEGQIALSHAYGNGGKQSCRNTSEAVSELLHGMKIDHYMSVTMDAVPMYNDLLGGVEVTVLDDFSGVDDNLVKGQKVVLKGTQALTYVRSRYGMDDSTNNARMNRQRQYLNALYDKTMKAIEADEEFVVSSTLTLSEYMISDRSVTQLQELIRKFTEYEFLGIENIQGESKMGEKYIEFYPNEDALQEKVIKLFYKLKD